MSKHRRNRKRKPSLPAATVELRYIDPERPFPAINPRLEYALPKVAPRYDPDVRGYLASRFTVHRNATGLLVVRRGDGIEYLGRVTL